jgi:hypothetical protein
MGIPGRVCFATSQHDQGQDQTLRILSDCFWFFCLFVLFCLAVLCLNSELHSCKSGALPLEPLPQSFLLWLFWRWGLAFCLGQPGPRSYFRLHTIARMTGSCHDTQFFSVEIGSYKFIPPLSPPLLPPRPHPSPDWSRTVILLLSASHGGWDDRHAPLCAVIG